MSSISSACIKAEAAALSAMAAILKEKHALEKCEEDSLAAARKCEEDSLAAARKCEEEQIRQRKEWLELQSGIAAYTAKANVLRYRGSEVQSSRADSNGTNSYLDRAKRKISLRPSATEFIPQGSEGQFNPSPKGGSRAVVSVETLHKDVNLQYHNPTEEDKNFALSMGAHPKDSNQQLHHPPVGGSKTLLPMEAFTATTIPEGNGSKAYELNPTSSQIYSCQNSSNAEMCTKASVNQEGYSSVWGRNPPTSSVPPPVCLTAGCTGRRRGAANLTAAE
ncbi:hypothetical protein F7725_013458 [Dissostichus mawsoni]|uniref:Uncharacterized protein n=1 Tax=Dissostichus mawsoni TaxID=36200 RepID=A0A7J5YQ99_DISMA|nr:hypothetical protein F7725_013458 [Dissostichus mawsoni]